VCTVFHIKLQKEEKESREITAWKYYVAHYIEYTAILGKLKHYSVYTAITNIGDISSIMDVINEHYNSKCI
jgi:hypothetical protein